MRTLVIAACLVVPGAAHASPLAGETPGAAPAPTATASAGPAATTPRGLALGVELGDPISATAAYFTGKLMLAGAIGSATLESPGVTVHADAQVVAKPLSPRATFRTGLGLRYYRHSRLASPDELPSSHFGVRLPNTIAVRTGSVELYAELAPGIDFKRTNSCNLADGPYSVCPHAQESPLFLEAVVGLRLFLSH
ncbi:MAG TPA: hypothetical protein VFT22_22635 [Kofleriaceae bacterium]|nr:hypothetical protein [Kofleriaceae bacterium]